MNDLAFMVIFYFLLLVLTITNKNVIIRAKLTGKKFFIFEYRLVILDKVFKFKLKIKQIVLIWKELKQKTLKNIKISYI